MRFVALAMIGLLTLAAAAPRRPFLVEELPYIQIDASAEIAVIACYREMLGSTFTVENSDAVFVLPPEVDFPILRREDLRNNFLIIGCRVASQAATKGTRQFLVSSIAAAPAPGEFFGKLVPELESFSPVRRCLVAAWAANSGKRLGDKVLTTLAQDTLLSSLAALLDASIKAGRVEDLAWLERGNAALHGDPRWQKMLLEFANCYGDRREIAEMAQKIGLYRTGDKWRIEGEFLLEIGMVRKDEKVVTRERSLLDAAMQVWEQSRRSSQQLRGLTANQYLQHAREHHLVTGMNRAEVTITWGYPDKVTWVRRENVIMEAWFYESRYACLTDGFVFHIQE